MITRWATARVAGYASLTVVGLVTALVAGRPEPALLAAPFALFLAAGLAFVPPAAPASVTMTVDHDRLIEGDAAELTITAPPGAEVRAVLPPDLEVGGVDGGAGRLALRLHPRRWGAFRIGRAAVRVADPLRLFVTETPVNEPTILRVQPSPFALRRAVEAAQLQRRVGNHTSRSRGDGI